MLALFLRSERDRRIILQLTQMPTENAPFLEGERAERRIGEAIGSGLASVVGALPFGATRRIRPVPARLVARALIALAKERAPGVRFVESEAISRSRPDLSQSPESGPASRCRPKRRPSSSSVVWVLFKIGQLKKGVSPEPVVERCAFVGLAIMRPCARSCRCSRHRPPSFFSMWRSPTISEILGDLDRGVVGRSAARSWLLDDVESSCPREDLNRCRCGSPHRPGSGRTRTAAMVVDVAALDGSSSMSSFIPSTPPWMFEAAEEARPPETPVDVDRGGGGRVDLGVLDEDVRCPNRSG